MKNFISEYSDNVERYLKEVSKTALLNASEEVELAQKIQKGDQKALDTLVKANLRFVIKVASNYQNQGVPFADLICVGNWGLIKAAKRFDEKKNFKFISYAVWWVRQAILEELANHSRVVRIPTSGIGRISQLDRIYQKMVKERNGDVSIDDMVEETGLSKDEILAFIGLKARAFELDKSLKDGGTTFLDTMAAPDDNNFLEHNSRSKIIREFLGTLSDRERYVTEQFFGFNDIPKTLEEIAGHLNLTRERIRQIKEIVLRKLKEFHTGKSNELC